MKLGKKGDSFMKGRDAKGHSSGNAERNSVKSGRKDTPSAPAAKYATRTKKKDNTAGKGSMSLKDVQKGHGDKIKAERDGPKPDNYTPKKGKCGGTKAMNFTPKK